MEKRVITLSREFGSGGRTIAHRVDNGCRAWLNFTKVNMLCRIQDVFDTSL